jgi:hypothetical protein
MNGAINTPPGPKWLGSSRGSVYHHIATKLREFVDRLQLQSPDLPINFLHMFETQIPHQWQWLLDKVAV